MELAQLKEAGSSQAEQRAAGEQAVAKAKVKLEKLSDLVGETKVLYEEADGKPLGIRG